MSPRITLSLAACSVLSLATLSRSARADDFDHCMEWFAGLGHPELKDAPLVKVTTGSWMTDADGTRHTQHLEGFLVKRPDESGSFAIVNLALHRREFSVSPPGTEEHARLGFEEIPFKAWASGVLKRFSAPPPKEPQFLGFGSTPMLTPTLEAFHAAVACSAKGEDDLAQKIFAKIPPSRLGRGKPGELDTLEVLQRETGHAAMWATILSFGDPDVSRSELLSELKPFGERYPTSSHRDRAGQLAEILDEMIVEDAAHARAREKRPFGELGKQDQIADLIFRLRDQNGHQWSQPGSCDIFLGDFRGEAPPSPAKQLLDFGFEAVPALIEAMDDPRPTRSVGYHRNFYFSHYVLRIGDAAQQILYRLTGESFYQRVTTSGAMVKDGKVAEAKAKALAWWLEFEKKGEKRLLIERVSAGGQDAPTLLGRLAEGWPEEVAAAARAGLAACKKSWGFRDMVGAIGRAMDKGAPGAEAVLEEAMRQRRVPAGALEAVRVLYRLGNKGALDEGLAMWADPAIWETKGTFDDLLAEEVLGFLLDCDEGRALEGVAGRLGDLTLDMCRKIATKFYGDIVEMGEARRAIVEQMLVELLEDTRVRSGLTGSIGGFSYRDPRICDLAGVSLARGWPEQYPFDYEAELLERDRARVRNLNRWRAANGKPSLPSAWRTPPEPLGVKDFAPIRKHLEAGDLQAFRHAAAAAGIAALKPLIEVRQDIGEEEARVLNEVIAALGNRVESVEVKPEGVAFPPVARWLEGLQGKVLTADATVELLVAVSREIEGSPVRKFTLEIYRHSNLSGIDVVVTLAGNEDRERPIDQWNSSFRISLAGKSLGSGSSGGALDFQKKPEAHKKFRDAMAAALAADVHQPFELRWRRIGFWHSER